MKKISFKDFSLLGLVLMGASALTAAMIPSKSNAEPQDRIPNNGVIQPSTGGLDRTVRPLAGGVRSYTVTGLAGANNDEASGTSVNGKGLGTQTNEISWATESTTATALENVDPS